MVPPGKRNPGINYWIPTCRTRFVYSFISQEKGKEKIPKNLSETCHWKLIFIIWSYSTWAHRHARHVSTLARKAREHVSTQNTLTRGHLSTQGTFPRKHARYVGTSARKGSLSREHVSTKDTLARKHARLAGTWARRTHNLADSCKIK